MAKIVKKKKSKIEDTNVEMNVSKIEPNILLQRSQSSCTIKRDGKGVVTFELKVYADDIGEAVKKATEKFVETNEEY